MQFKKNPGKCGLDYQVIVRGLLQDLMKLRQQSAQPDEYLYWLRLVLFKELYGLQESWAGLSRCFEGGTRITNAKAAYETIYKQVFMANKATFMLDKHRFDSLFKGEPRVGSVSFAGLRELADIGSSGDNSVVEELEYIYVARCTLVPVSLWWAALGLVGVPKRLSFFQVVQYLPCDAAGTFHPAWLDSFASYFKCVETAVNPAVGGTQGVAGLYSSLPPLW